MTRGARNLAILSVASITIALVTTGASLYLYRSSGDIYLDRSRPGFLPKDSSGNIKQSGYVFPSDGAISEEVIDQYLESLDAEVELFQEKSNGKKAFDEADLSDQNLGIED